MTPFTFLLLALAVYRLTHFIVFDKLFERVRSQFVKRGFDGQNITFTLQGTGIRRFIGQIINCYWCAGIWVSALFIVGYLTAPTVAFYIAAVLALAAVQSIGETLILKASGMPLEMTPTGPATHEEDGLGVARGFVNAVIITVGIAVIIAGCWYLIHVR
ncbi:DUF1360 domain-containing protein [Paenibacillus sedimenti]|uniref:DUF1360 domain-containing protein n=1 Tax=Paenibacillus sedimenti TaxID=2770274 RepID=A0A926KP01_9BACL|nr:DUF1360 domain-containing protein [Paenibacillus sedimenti]MBD0381240.1 DUF1360 domain-containing protein [Paenibacillus sedimenti]